MYNFHKVRGDRNYCEFQHDRFVKNHPELLPEIKRKQIESNNHIPSISFLPMPDNPPEPTPTEHKPRVSFGGAVSFKTEQFGLSQG